MHKKLLRRNNLKQIALASHVFESAHKSLPFNISEKGKISPDLSWRVLISPFIDGPTEFDTTQGPTADKNAQFASQMPSLLGEGKTHSFALRLQNLYLNKPNHYSMFEPTFESTCEMIGTNFDFLRWFAEFCIVGQTILILPLSRITTSPKRKRVNL